MAEKGLEELTWANVKCWSDILQQDEKQIIRETIEKIPRNKICPLLRTIVENGEIQWVYCQQKHNGTKESAIPHPLEPRYRAFVETSSLQLFCADNNIKFYDDCIYYKEWFSQKLQPEIMP